jgi:hypothetical protein
MEKRVNISQTVLHLLEGLVAGKTDKRARVCVIMSRDDQVARAVASQGHRLVVAGDRFKPLFRFNQRNRPYNPVLAVETEFRALPLLPEAFDVIIVARPLPGGSDLGRELQRLRQFLKSGGTLMWIHPIYRGLAGRLQRAFAPRLHRMERHILCRTAMEQGFRQIGQETVRGYRGARYVLTRATLQRHLS